MDKRPDPKERKLKEIGWYYGFYDELVEMRKRHLLRISSAEKGKTANVNIEVEHDFMERLSLDDNIKYAEKLMVKSGETAGDVWDWLTSIKGLGTGSLAVRLLAMIDDIGKFDMISRLWRFAGLAVIDGKAERGTKHYNRKLKALLLGPTLIVDQFVRQHTPTYREVYDDEKERLYRLHPDPLCNKCGAVAELKGKSWRCPNGCRFKAGDGFKVDFTPLHIDKMARRKVAKVFLSHVWLMWREQEGLPLTLPWILREGTGHTTFIMPPYEMAEPISA